MDILDKAHIICEYYEKEEKDRIYIDFMVKNDMGVPLSIAYNFDLVELKPSGVEVIEETWNNLCELYATSPNEEYETLEDLETGIIEFDDEE